MRDPADPGRASTLAAIRLTCQVIDPATYVAPGVEAPTQRQSGPPPQPSGEPSAPAQQSAALPPSQRPHIPAMQAQFQAQAPLDAQGSTPSNYAPRQHNRRGGQGQRRPQQQPAATAA